MLRFILLINFMPSYVYLVSQAVQTLVDLTTSLNTTAHIPNWDLIASVVNATSRVYRSPKQCKNRYENVIVPREEGKLVMDSPGTLLKKQKKTATTLVKGMLRVGNGACRV